MALFCGNITNIYQKLFMVINPILLCLSLLTLGYNFITTSKKPAKHLLSVLGAAFIILSGYSPQQRILNEIFKNTCMTWTHFQLLDAPD